MERIVLLKSLGWGTIIAEVPSGAEGPDMDQTELVDILNRFGLPGVTGILPDPSGAPFAVVLAAGQEPCQIERDLMGPEEVSLLRRVSKSCPNEELRQRMNLLGLTDHFHHPETVQGRVISPDQETVSDLAYHRP